MHPETGNCCGSSCNPMFVNAAGGDFTLQSGSPAIDAGDPHLARAGRRRLARRYRTVRVRRRGTVPYQYEPKFTVADQTPRFTWNIHDVDNDLDSLINNLAPGDTDYQTKYQIQIDPTRTFDSVGGTRPLLDSGQVSISDRGIHRAQQQCSFAG